MGTILVHSAKLISNTLKTQFGIDEPASVFVDKHKFAKTPAPETPAAKKMPAVESTPAAAEASTPTPTAATPSGPPSTSHLLHNTIIIHPGSLYLRIGRASDAQPQQLLHAVAHRRRDGAATYNDPFLPTQRRPPTHGGAAASDTRTTQLIARALHACQPPSSSSPAAPSPSPSPSSSSSSSSSLKRKSPGAVPPARAARCSPKRLAALNAGARPQRCDDAEPRAPHHSTDGRPTVCGDDILRIDPAALADVGGRFNVHLPWRGGALNVHGGLGGSVQSVVGDLHACWSHALHRLLDVKPAALRAFRAVLIVPDVYDRAHLRELVSLLLQPPQGSGHGGGGPGLGFGSAFLVQDHVAATFGAGMPFACVVDCGDRKTSVSCVEDGISQAGTRVRLAYGAADVAQVLAALAPVKVAAWRRRDGVVGAEAADLALHEAMWLRRAAECCCHVDWELLAEPLQRRLRVDGEQPGEKPSEWTVQLGEEALVAPLALFRTELLQLARRGARSDGVVERSAVRLQRTAAQQPDAEDCFDAEYLRETGRKYTREQLDTSGTLDATAAATATAPATVPVPTTPSAHSEDVASNPVVPTNNSKAPPTAAAISKPDPSTTADFSNDFQTAGGQIVGIDQAILRSIERCGSDDLKRKMYGNVLVVGGGMRYPGMARWLQTRLAAQIPAAFRSTVPATAPAAAAAATTTSATAAAEPTASVNAIVDIVTTGTKDGDTVATAWRGAAIMAGLESAPELFIEASEWEKCGVRLLRERAIFMW